jgi:enamine deaminase RidA (YjgF/YER057c/UK114 family)
MKPKLKEKKVSVYERLKALNINIAPPKLTPPVAAYVPFLRSGNLVFLAGHIAKIDGQPWVGQLGANLTTEQGKNAARTVAIDLIGTLQAAVSDLNKVKRIVKLMVLVNSTPAYTEQHLVANGASEFFAEIFGEMGMHVRCAFGVAQIPFGACVEIDLIAEVAD